MAEQETITVEIPAEPPEYTVVAPVYDNGSGQPWCRYDDLVRDPGWWYPAGRYYDDRDKETVEPLRWRQLVAKHGRLTVLRWGRGETLAVTDA